jgi:hypothetical protein
MRNEETSLHESFKYMRDEFDLSASANLKAPSSSILLTVSCENETKQQTCYLEIVK